MLANRTIGTDARIGVSYIGSDASTADATTYDHGNFSAPSDGLMVVVQGGGRDALRRTISSISIGGTNGTLVAPGTSDQISSLAYRAVSAGNNNVTVVYSGGASERDTVNVYLLTRYESATPTTSATGITWTSSTRAMTMTIPVGGVALYGVAHADTGAISWDNATEDYDATVELFRISSASLVGVHGSHTETATFGGSAEGSNVYACWR